MNVRLKRISPGDLGLMLGAVGFIFSIPLVAFAFFAIGPGRTVNLKSFFTLTFTGSLDPIWLVLVYPILNALAGMISGFLLAWLYNFLAGVFGGITITLQE